MNIVKVFSALLAGLAMASCAQQVVQQPVRPAPVLRVLELPLGDAALQAQVSTVQPDSVLAFDAFATTPAAVVSSDANFRYILRTFQFANTTNVPLTNVSLYAYNQAASNKGGTAIKNLTNFVGGASADVINAQSLLPTHGMQGNGTVSIVPGLEDFQVYSDASAVQSAARTAGVIAASDTVLEYGFVARSLALGGGRTIGAANCNTAADANCNRGQVTVAYKIPLALATNTYGFSATFVVATESITRVTRSPEESTASAVARAAAPVNASQIVLVGNDSDSASGAVRLPNAKISTQPRFLVRNTNSACSSSLGNYRSIPEIQGSGLQSPLSGATGITTEGLVVGDFQGAAPNLRGYFIQSRYDADPTTSEGLFVFDNSNAVSVGDYVRLTGNVTEFARTSPSSPPDPVDISETQLTNISALELCQTAQPVTSVVVNFPLPNGQQDLEQYEGMLVTIPQTMTVTETFQLGRFGQVQVASGGDGELGGTDNRLDQFTQGNLPSAVGYAAHLARLAKRRLIVDDGQIVTGTAAGSAGQNPDPIQFGRNGNPLSAVNTLRGGDTVSNLTGVLHQRLNGPIFGGVAADRSSNAYRIQVTQTANFQANNARPALPLSAPLGLRVASFNVLNYFSTLGGGTTMFNTPSYTCSSAAGFSTSSFEVRGAENSSEFTRQKDKVVAAIRALNADVIGLNEVQNNGDADATSAIDNLVDALNAAEGSALWDYIRDPKTAADGNPGCDAIKVAFIYKVARVAPVGNAKALNSGAFGPFTLASGVKQRQRPPLAQTVQALAGGEQLTVVINHFKSKGSSCADNVSPVASDPDLGDGQGNCNLTRKQAALDLKAWLATNPTGSADPDYLLLGDLNAYAQEDPLTSLAPTFTPLLASNTYSYVFDGLWGSLDHALANSTLAAQVVSAQKVHINADEPNVLDYNTNFKSTAQQTSLYAADAFRSSDHDPIIVDFNLGNSGSGFTLSAGALSSSSFVAGTAGSSSSVVSVNRINFTDPVTLSLEVLPATAGISAIFSNNPNSSGTSTMSLSVANTVPAGNYTLTVKGTSGASAVSSNALGISVTAPCTGLSVTPSSASIAVGGTQQLTASFTPSGCSPQPSLTWSSANTGVASVSSSGLVSGIAAGGPVSISASAGSLSGSSSISVTAGTPVVPAIVINELRRDGDLTNTEYIELLLTQDLSAAQLESYFFGDSTSSTVAKFSVYNLSGLSSIASTFKKGTLIVIGGSAVAADTSYNPAANDWNLQFQSSSSYVTKTGSGSFDLAGSDVLWVDSSSSGLSSLDSIGWASSGGAFYAVAKVKIPAPSNASSVAFTGDNTTLHQASAYSAQPESKGQPNGAANTTYIDTLRQ
ncbi:MAG: ExeM/NucH family extracellular endonuclease [Deinococcales bacterium]